MRRMTLAAWTASCVLALSPVSSDVLAQGQPVQQDASISIDFKGGTVAEYINTLKKSGKAVNIVASERASKQQLAPVSLDQVSVGVAVFSIQAAATSGSGNWRIEAISPPGPQAMQFPGMPGSGVQAFAVDFYPYGKRGEDVVVESYSLQRIIKADGKAGGLDPNVVLTAIETGLKLQNEGSEQPPDLKFHPDSGLLFVRGTRADVQLVGSVVGRMLDDAKVRTAAAEKRAQENMVRNIAMKEAKLDVEFREMELAMAQKKLEQVKELAEKGAVPPMEVMGIETEFARARMNLERAKLGVERAQIVTGDPIAEEQPAANPAKEDPTTAPAAPGGAPKSKSTKRPAAK